MCQNPARLAPPAPPPPSPELVRFVREGWAVSQWNEAVNRESWRLARAEGGNRCGPEQYARGRQSLIDQGRIPPDDPHAW